MRPKTTLCLLLFLIILAAVSMLPQALAQTSSTGALTLEDGTPIKLRLSRTVSSADARVGDTVDFDVLEEVKVGGLLVIPKAGVAWGTVTEAEAKRRMARGGKLNMNIDSVRLLDGEKVALRAVKEMKGGGHTGAMTGGIVATAIVFWPAAPFFLFMHGKDIVIPKGTEITAYINGNFSFDAAKFQNASQLNQATSAQTTPSPANGVGNIPAGGAALEISSTPPNGDIELDGSFAGNTPSSLGIAAGEHTVKITKNGYKSWERKLRTSAGTVRLVADLEPSGLAAVPSSAVEAPSPAVTQQPTVPRANDVREPNSAVTTNSSPVPAEVPATSHILPTNFTSNEHSATPAKGNDAKQTASQPSPSEPDGTASITSTPDAADIFVDSIGYGHTPALVKLKPGKHTIQLARSGYKDFVSDVIVNTGSIVNVTANLEK